MSSNSRTEFDGTEWDDNKRRADLVTAALEYAEAGLRVLPLNGGTPCAPGGVLSASSDAELIKMWWQTWPDAGIGCVVDNDHAVLEVDIKNDGFKSLAVLEEENGPLAPTLCTYHSGKKFLYYRNQAEVRECKLAPGLELKGPGSVLLLPPSHDPENGKQMYWYDNEHDVGLLRPWVAELAELEAAKIATVHADSEISSTTPFCGAGPLTVGKEEPTVRGITLTNLSEREPQELRWLWDGRFPLGKLTVLDGDPGLGKSTLLMDLAARVTTARAMPDGSPSDLNEPGMVLLWSAEDGVDDTIVPRLIAAQGNRDLFRHWPNEHMPVIPDSLDTLKQFMNHFHFRLLIIDPLMSFLGDDVRANQDQSIRRALAPMAALAEETECAVVVVRHLNKRNGDAKALYRGGGSIGIAAAARSVLMVARDPDNDGGKKMILASVKSNLSTPPPSLAYHIEETVNKSSRVVWDGVVTLEADDLLLARSLMPGMTARDEAKEFLKVALCKGEVEVSRVQGLARARGISLDTLGDAKRDLGVIHRATGFGEDKVGYWSLPETPPTGI